MADEKLTISEFASKIKTKYPVYESIDDTTLTEKILAKYPTYKEQIDIPADFFLSLKEQSGDFGDVSEVSESETPSTSGSVPQDVFDTFFEVTPSKVEETTVETEEVTPEPVEEPVEEVATYRLPTPEEEQELVADIGTYENWDIPDKIAPEFKQILPPLDKFMQDALESKQDIQTRNVQNIDPVRIEEAEEIWKKKRSGVPDEPPEIEQIRETEEDYRLPGVVKIEEEERKEMAEMDPYFWGTVRAINEGTSSFFRTLDNAATTISDVTGWSKSGSFADIADFIEERSVQNLPEAPNTVIGNALTDLGHLEGMFLELAITPQFKLARLGQGTGGAIKLNMGGNILNSMAKVGLGSIEKEGLRYAVPKFPVQMGTSAFFNTYGELTKENKETFEKSIDAFKAMGIGAFEGAAFTMLGYRAGMASKAIKDATKSGMAAWASGVGVNAGGFGGFTALEQLATTGDIDWRDVRRSTVMGVGLGLPGLPNALMGRAIGNYITSSDKVTKFAEQIKENPEVMRERSAKLRKKAAKETNEKKTEELLLEADIIDNLTDIKVINADVALNPNKYRTAIEADKSLSRYEKDFMLTKINETVAEHDPNIKKARPISEEIESLKRKIDNIEQSGESESIKESQKKVIETQIKEKQGELDAVFAKEPEEVTVTEKAPETEIETLDRETQIARTELRSLRSEEKTEEAKKLESEIFKDEVRLRELVEKEEDAKRIVSLEAKAPKELIGEQADYGGIKGKIAKDSEGNIVIETVEGKQHIVEEGLSNKPAQELGIKITEARRLPINEINERKEIPDTEIQAKASFDGETNTIRLFGNEYAYEKLNKDAEGNLVSLEVRDAEGNLKTIENPEVLAEIDIQIKVSDLKQRGEISVKEITTEAEKQNLEKDESKIEAEQRRKGDTEPVLPGKPKEDIRRAAEEKPREEPTEEQPITKATYEFEKVKSENLEKFDYYEKEVEGETKYFKKEKPPEAEKPVEEGTVVGEEVKDAKVPDLKEALELVKEAESEQGGRLYPEKEETFDENYDQFKNKEEAETYITNEVLPFFESLPENVPIYRAVEAEEVNFDPYGIGESWTSELSAAKEFGSRANANKIIKGYVKRGNIDFKTSIQNFSLFSDLFSAESEFELHIPANSKITNIKVEGIKEATELSGKIPEKIKEKPPEAEKPVEVKEEVEKKGETTLYHGSTAKISGRLTPKLTLDDHVEGVSFFSEKEDAKDYGNVVEFKASELKLIEANDLFDNLEYIDAKGELLEPKELKEKLTKDGYDGINYENLPMEGGGYGIRVFNLAKINLKGRPTPKADKPVEAKEEAAEKPVEAKEEVEVKEEVTEPIKKKPGDQPTLFSEEQIETATEKTEQQLGTSGREKRIKITEVNKDVDLFQNREEEYSEETVKSITNDVRDGTFNENVLDPIRIWKNPKDGKFYILAGHSRVEAYRRLAEEGKKAFKDIPAIELADMTLEQAKEFATVKSNMLGTQETMIARSNVYRKMQKEGKSKSVILAEAKKNEGRNAVQVVNLSVLNPNGKALDAVRSFEKSTDVGTRDKVNAIADWIGGSRNKYKELGNAHENELFDFLMSAWVPRKQKGDKSKVSNKHEFEAMMEVVISRAKKQGEFTHDIPLNIKNTIGRSPIEIEYDSELAAKRANVTEARKLLDEKRAELLERGADKADMDRIMPEYENKVRLALAEEKYVREQKGLIKEAAKDQTSLFDELTTKKQATDETIREFTEATEKVKTDEATIKAVEGKAKDSESLSSKENRETLDKIEEVIEGEAKKPTEAKEPTIEEKRKTADSKIQEGLEDFLDAIGGRAKLAGEKRPDAIKALKKMVEGLAEKGIIEAEAVIKELKGKLDEKWHDFIDKNRKEILKKEAKKEQEPEKEKEPEKTEDEISLDESLNIEGEKIPAPKSLAGIEKAVKQKKKLIETENKKETKNLVRDLIFVRRADISLASFETSLFVDGIRKRTTEKQRELIPFLIERTKVPKNLNRPDLEELYKTDKDKLEPIVKEVRDHFDKMWKKIVENTDKLSTDQIEDYVTHIWDIPKAKKQEVVNWFATKNRFLNKRYISTLEEGIEKFGLKPKYLDINDIIKIHGSMANNVIANNKFIAKIKELGREGMPMLLRSDKAPPEWEYIDHPALTTNFYIPGAEGAPAKIIPTRYKVHPDLKKPLLVIFDKKLDHNIIRALETINGILKKTSLSLSLFHHGALTETAVAKMGLAKTLKVFGKDYVYEGLKKSGSPPAFKNPELTRDALKDGVQLGASMDIPVQKIQGMLDTMAKRSENIPGAKQLTAFAKTFNEKWDSGLWDYLHDGLKLYAYESAMSNMPKKLGKLSREDPKQVKWRREQAQLINDTFGGQNFETLMMNPKTLQIFRWGLLSPDWTISTIRQALAPTGVGAMYKETRGARRKAGAMFWLKAAVYYGVGINMMNLYFRQKDEEENPELYDKKLAFRDKTMFGNTVGHKTHLFTGRYDDGTERYMRWGKQFRELIELIMDDEGMSLGKPLLKKLGGKFSPVQQIWLKMFTGRSGSGYEDWDTKDKKGWEFSLGLMKMLGKSALPFSSSSLMRDDKEWYPMDLAFPSSKGMSRSKAINLFKKAIARGDENYFKEVYIGAVRNNLDAFGLAKTGLAVVKGEGTKELTSDIKTVEDAKKKLKETSDTKERKKLKRKISSLKAEEKRKRDAIKLLDKALSKAEDYFEQYQDVSTKKKKKK